MLYIKRVVVADITRQIGLTQKVSDQFFRFNPNLTYEKFLKFQKRSGETYTGFIKKTGHSITITGDIYSYVKDTCEYGDILLFKNTSSLDEFTFIVVKKGSQLYNECDKLLQCHGSRNNTISNTTHLLTRNTSIEVLF